MTCARTCATCAWWQRRGPKLANASRDPSAASDEGTCQRRAPVIVHDPRSFPVTMFPVVLEHRFCGDWRAKHEGDGPDDGERVVAFPGANRVAA
jgi:hypothetical protein